MSSQGTARLEKVPSIGSAVTATTWIESVGDDVRSQERQRNLASVRSAHRKSILETDHNNDDQLVSKVFLVASYLLLAATFPLSILLCLKVVREYERAVVFRLGKLVGHGARGPGLIFVLPCIDDYSVLDLRTITFDVPPQEMLTKDSVTIMVDAVVYYRIWLPTIAVSNVYDYGQATKLLASSILRNILGTKTLTELLAEQKQLRIQITEMLDDITKLWGVKVERVEIKNLRLPTNFQRSMAVEADTDRNAKAKIISAEGEKQSAHAVLEAAQIMASAELGMPLRYLQNLTNSNADTKETIVFFPVPMPMLSVQLDD